MKKKAFTLIELVIVMALIVILSITSVSTLAFYKKISADLKTKESLYEIREFLSYSKKYCLSHKMSGYVLANKLGETYNMILADNKTNIYRELNIDNMVFINSKCVIPQETNVINVNDKGVLDSTSIYLLGEDGLKYKITILVGSNKINVRKYYFKGEKGQRLN